ncbi:hypothetical protein [Virgisporangium aliadipatigenens]|nr:hypothetical protein [Virgisporangium aliadipatigenens]
MTAVRGACLSHTNEFGKCVGGLLFHYRRHVLASCDDRCSSHIVGGC